jgi:hypothetical protein
MRSKEEAIMSGTPGAQDPNQFNEADFQAVLKALLAAYQPELEADLRRARAPDDLTKEARGGVARVRAGLDEIDGADTGNIVSGLGRADIGLATVPLGPRSRESLRATKVTSAPAAASEAP